MLYAIPIQPETLDLIALINEGVRPEVEDIPTVFVYYGHKPSQIMAHVEFFSKLYGPRPTIFACTYQE